MKTCSICGKHLQHHAAKRCDTCRPIYQKKHQEEYRKNNRKICQERSKKSYLKKMDKYNKKRREYYRKTHGLPLDYPVTKRKDGEGNIDNSGYKTITKRGHPNQMDSRGRIREHVFVMSEHLGRPLMKGETVYHINGIRLDNRIENLELWHRSHPPGQRLEDKINWAIEFLKDYGYKVTKE
jgi:hypothetical protein